MEEVDKIATKIYSEKANLLPGFMELITFLKENRIPIGIASSSRLKWINIIVDRFGIRPYFQSIMSANELNAPGKPAPDIYLAAAKALNTNPKECLL